MKLRFRSSCPDIISGRPQAARSLRRKRSCRENSAAGVGLGAGDSDLSGKTAFFTDNLLILNNLSGKYPLSPDKSLGRRCGSPPSLRDFVRWCSDISRRRSCAPPFLRDFVRCRSGISRMWFCAPPSLGDFVAVAPTSPAACGGAVQMIKENQRSSELDADFLLSFAERRRFELLIPFWSIHAFQACLLSHSSISP